jgi:hypothetical protein
MGRGASFVIGVFYLFVVIVGVLLLATVQLRSSGGSTYDTWSLNYDSNRVLFDTHQDQLDSAQKALSDAHSSLNFDELCLHLFDNTTGNLKQPITAEVSAELAAAKADPEKAKTLEGDAKCIFRGVTLLNYDESVATTDIKDLPKEIQNIEGLLKSDSDQYSDLIKGHQEFLAFKEMEKKWYTKPFVIAPYDFLVLLLVMSMGALGGMVRILRDYGDPNRPNPAPRDYFFIPLIGVVVAIGGYVLAKTGLLLLSSTKEETSLSPFMIGLVGIVSGLLAREVIDRLAGAGRHILENRAPQAKGGKVGRNRRRQRGRGTK